MNGHICRAGASLRSGTHQQGANAAIDSGTARIAVIRARHVRRRCGPAARPASNCARARAGVRSKRCCVAIHPKRRWHRAHRCGAEAFRHRRYIKVPYTASHNVCAFSKIASNTGARSPGDELMTCKTSAVAVCCSNASRVSVNSRAFSIAMTACAAKFSSSAISFSVNGRTSFRADGNHTEELALSAQWHAEQSADADQARPSCAVIE